MILFTRSVGSTHLSTASFSLLAPWLDVDLWGTRYILTLTAMSMLRSNSSPLSEILYLFPAPNKTSSLTSVSKFLSSRSYLVQNEMHTEICVHIFERYIINAWVSIRSYSDAKANDHTWRGLNWYKSHSHAEFHTNLMVYRVCVPSRYSYQDIRGSRVADMHDALSIHFTIFFARSVGSTSLQRPHIHSISSMAQSWPLRDYLHPDSHRHVDVMVERLSIHQGYSICIQPRTKRALWRQCQKFWALCHTQSRTKCIVSEISVHIFWADSQQPHCHLRCFCFLISGIIARFPMHSNMALNRLPFLSQRVLIYQLHVIENVNSYIAQDPKPIQYRCCYAHSFGPVMDLGCITH